MRPGSQREEPCPTLPFSQSSDVGEGRGVELHGEDQKLDWGGSSAGHRGRQDTGFLGQGSGAHPLGDFPFAGGEGVGG